MTGRSDLMNLRNIEVFRAIMKLGTVTSAADALGTSQPTVTRELSRLESSLGFVLFERRRQRLVPTLRAHRLYKEIQVTFSGLEKLNQFVSGLRGVGDEVLTVSTLPAFAVSLLPEVIALLQMQVPALSVDIRTEDPRDESPVSGFDFDVGLIEGDFASQSVEVTVIRDFELVAVLPAGHPLSARAQLAPADFAAVPFISLGANDPSRLRLNDVFEEAGVVRRMSVSCQSATGICEMVAQGLGVSIVNPLTALQYQRSGLVVKRFAPQLTFRISALRPLDRPQMENIDRFLRCLKEVCRLAGQALIRQGLEKSDEDLNRGNLPSASQIP